MGSRSLTSHIQKSKQLWDGALASSERKPKVLVATSMGCYQHAVVFEGVLAAALVLRGAEVDFLLCDSALPCCQMTKMANVSSSDLLKTDSTPRCEACQAKGKAEYGGLGLPIRYLGENLSQDEREEVERLSTQTLMQDIPHLEFDGIAVGEHAQAGALRFFGRGDLETEPLAEPILRRYLKAAFLCLFATRNILRKHQYDIAVFHHGIYVPQGIIGEVCRREGVRVVNWNPSYRKQTFVFSHGDTYHHTMVTDPVSIWDDFDLTPERDKRILHYLKSRWYGDDDWIWFHESPEYDLETIASETGIDFSKPVIGALTSVMWDAQLHYKSNAFDNQIDWMRKTIELFSELPDLQLVIRVHPAEVNGMVPSRQKMADVIESLFPDLASNIHVIPPESQVSTYAVMQACDSVIIYNTKMGIELSSMGIPVIVAGEAWIRNKGFSRDASSPEEYQAIIGTLPVRERLSDELLLRAKRYAYYFFFRRMISIPFVVATKNFKFGLNLQKLHDLLPGGYEGLDVICDGILYGKPFVQEME